MTAKKVLVIEDESMLRGVLVENLTKEGYKVAGFADAYSAFDYMREEKPDIILTDLVLANFDGYEILRQLKANVQLSKIPVIILSNLDKDDAIERAMSLGAADFIIKANVSLKEITKRVKKALAKKK